jgi:hypothetical protein
MRYYSTEVAVLVLQAVDFSLVGGATGASLEHAHDSFRQRERTAKNHRAIAMTPHWDWDAVVLVGLGERPQLIIANGLWTHNQRGIGSTQAVIAVYCRYSEMFNG